MDRNLLVDEIRKRPPLWDFSNGKIKTRVPIPELWKEVAKEVQHDVSYCKRKWKNLRDAYRAEVKRVEARIESDKLRGVYSAKNDYSSKWVFFEDMNFIYSSLKKRQISIEYEPTNSNSNENDDDAGEDSTMYDQFHRICDIKLEPHHGEDEDITLVEDGNDNTALYNVSNLEDHRQYDTTDDIPLLMRKNLTKCKRRHEESVKEPTTSNPENCKKYCQNNQMLNLEKLVKDDQDLITSNGRDIPQSNKLIHIGDSDYNFLVSFIPQIKKMSELQNLQFRAKLSELILNVLTPQ